MHDDLMWRMKGYKKCSECGALIPVSFLKNGLCVTCDPERLHKCFFCGSRFYVKKFRHRQFGLTWICRFCKRKDDEVVL